MSIGFSFQFEEQENSPRWSLDRDSGISGEREFKVPWGNATEFVVGMTNGYFPGFPAALAKNFSIKPFVSKPDQKTLTNLLTDINTHEWARVVVSYASVDSTGTREEQPDGTFISYRQGTSVQYQTVPSRSLVWDDNDAIVSPEAYPVMPISETDHVITWSEVDNPPWAFISSAKGKVNSASYDIPVIGLSVAAEQLLFESAETNAKIDAEGNAKWELTYTLKERKPTNYGASDVGWNHQFRDDPAGWVKVKDKENDNYTFATADLSAIFTQQT